MKTLRLIHPSKIIKGEIHLPSSKSESNRILMIKAISDLNIEIKNLSPSKDTKTLSAILEQVKLKKENELNTYDVGHAGTTMRFLTAYFSCLEGERILTGSERMQQRPIGELVDALRKLGADIEYMGKKGYPPLKIIGGDLHGGEIEMDGSVSSQFISALLMISPLLHHGLVLRFTGKVVSRPYINMTLKLMENYGVVGNWEDDVIEIKNQQYGIHVSKQNYSFEEDESVIYVVEGDWSSASYIFSLAALAKEADFKIVGLKPNSYQGDALTKELFEFFGIHASWEGETLHLTKSGKQVSQFHYNFEDCPDIAQTMAVVTSALKIPAVFTGLSTLRVKETDRIRALNNELSKYGVLVEEMGDEGIRIDPLNFNSKNKALVLTYKDHRMALSFATLALVCDEVNIDEPEVIEKSYPDFWKDIEKLGFEVR